MFGYIVRYRYLFLFFGTAFSTIEMPQQKKVKLFMVLGAADNDLFPFAGRNIKQMQNPGSNENVIIMFHLNMHRPGQEKISKNLLIGKNKLTQIGDDASVDSGDPQTLIDFCSLCIKTFPQANEFDLVLWNHGTGPIEPTIFSGATFRKIVNPSQLFRYNSETKLAELDRSIGFFDYINKNNEVRENMRGICFDDTTGNYLTNEKLKGALHTIVHDLLKGQKLNIIGFDACMMSDINVASIVKDYADIMVGSQEVELGTGWDYSAVLAPYAQGAPDNVSFAKNIVTSFHKTYSRITHDFTQSAIDLSQIDALEKNLEDLATILINGLAKQKNKTVKNAIKISKDKRNCTQFDEPTYKDMGDLYDKLLQNVPKCELGTTKATANFKRDLTALLTEGKKLLAKAIIANTAGKNLSRAQGLSIYFPEYQIHSSYRKQKSKWLQFLEKYVLA